MSSKSEIKETSMFDDELYEGSKELQGFEGAASGGIKDTRERKQTMKHSMKNQIYASVMTT